MDAGGFRFKAAAARRRRLSWLLLAFFLLSIPVPVAADSWEPVADGIDYRVYREPGPNVVHVARMARGRPDLTVETSLANREVHEGKQTVSGMVKLYDETLSSWEPTWGGRMDVKVAINGSFHDIEDGTPHSGMVQSGWYIRRFNNYEGGSGFVWRLDGSAFIGTCINQPPEGQLVTVLRTGETFRFTGINRRGRADSFSIITHHYGRRSPERVGAEVLVQMDQPFTILEAPQMATGVVQDVRRGGGSSGIPFDHVILLARGEAVDWALENLEVGDRIGLSTQIDHYRPDCERRRGDSFAEAYSSLSGSFEFLMDGDIRSFDDLGAIVRNPRTAVCYNDDYLYFIVVDGRAGGYSVGMSIDELAHFCRDELETNWGINQDGGGSSAMWINGEIVNRPSDGSERAVANGLMMVEVEPMKRSFTFSPGDIVRATSTLDLRAGPGDNFQKPWDAADGQEGTVVAHRHGLQGVLATGDYWWPIDFGGQVGWVREEDVELVERGQATRPPKNPTPGPTETTAESLLDGQLWHQLNPVSPGPLLRLGW